DAAGAAGDIRPALLAEPDDVDVDRPADVVAEQREGVALRCVAEQGRDAPAAAARVVVDCEPGIVDRVRGGSCVDVESQFALRNAAHLRARHPEPERSDPSPGRIAKVVREDPMSSDSTRSAIRRQCCWTRAPRACGRTSVRARGAKPLTTALPRMATG